MRVFAVIWENENEDVLFDVIDVSKTATFGTQLHGGFSNCTFFAPSADDIALTRYHTFLGRFVVLVDEFMFRLYEGKINNVRLANNGLEVTAAGRYIDADHIFFDAIYFGYEATTNLIPNPSFEVNVTDSWSFDGGTGAARTRVTTDFKFGIAACQITQAESGTTARLYTSIAVSATTEYTCSLYVKDVDLQGSIYLKLIEKDSGAAEVKTTIKELTGITPDAWILYEQSITTTASTATVEVRIEVDNSGTPGDVLVDAIMFEQKPYSSGYTDGSLGALYSWSGTAHNSTSSRAAYSPSVADIIKDCIDMVPSWNGNKVHISNADFLVGSRDFTDKKVKEAIESMMAFGFSEADIRPVYFAIWDYGVPHLFAEPVPWQESDWFVSKHNIVGGTPGISLSLDNVYNRVYAVYDNQNAGPSKTLPSDDVLSQFRYGLREGLVQNGENPEGIAVAESIRDLALEKFKYPRPIYTLDITGVVRSRNGYHSNPAYIRAGQLVSLIDIDPHSVYVDTAGNAANGLSGFVLKTEYDANSRTMRLSFGSVDVSYEMIMARLGLSGGLV